LKKALGNEYYYILSQAYQGTTRYTGICLDDDCYYRVANLDYIWRDFLIPHYKKYLKFIKTKENIVLLDKKQFHENELAIFSATYFTNLKIEKPVGESGGWYTKDLRKWDMILFFNKVDKLNGLFE
jgi:hypothetical protein